jgi:hypothetical protein
MEQDKASEDHKKILSALEQRFRYKKLSERKNSDGSLCYQDFINAQEAKGNEAIPVRTITPSKK